MSALNRKEIIESVKESLANLNVGYIDLVLVHKTDPQCPIEGQSPLREVFDTRVGANSPLGSGLARTSSVSCWA
jgi:aryl-alcohol dehydrogenase-like predicted oxidoreductase